MTYFFSYLTLLFKTWHLWRKNQLTFLSKPNKEEIKVYHLKNTTEIIERHILFENKCWAYLNAEFLCDHEHYYIYLLNYQLLYSIIIILLWYYCIMYFSMIILYYVFQYDIVVLYCIPEVWYNIFHVVKNGRNLVHFLK